MEDCGKLRGGFAGVCLGVILLSGCSDRGPVDGGRVADEAVLLRVGGLEVRESDLLGHLDEVHAGRRDAAARALALEEMGKRAQLVALAIDSGLLDDAVVRAEVSRVLVNRVRELELVPLLRDQVVEEARLRELYEANLESFQANEKRQVAVLWLNPGADPERLMAYQERLKSARDWVLAQAELAEKPERGFAELAVDYSEHQASRFGGGIVGWLEAAGGLDEWTKAVAELVFALGEVGEMSEVVTRKEGVFLVRLLGVSPAITRPFETVKGDLERQELRRLREEAEAAFFQRVDRSFPLKKEAAAVPDMEADGK
jgi:parvulin-like peptidyl-prolyl isomerase